MSHEYRSIGSEHGARIKSFVRTTSLTNALLRDANYFRRGSQERHCSWCSSVPKRALKEEIKRSYKLYCPRRDTAACGHLDRCPGTTSTLPPAFVYME
ncbi:hypothetical protein RvY_15438 [Ramazzottius varieornatus]|uniref:Uncharacterized protein n=1 Tax=Ramazzottius varieornatus TaxID=947166 RepID=A0A1D1VY75_RAMVA|nr:hypothetical protein RvY_15438 [Ramazzottius varieornatus]